MKLVNLSELSTDILNKDCIFNETIKGKIIAVNPSTDEILVMRHDGTGHTASNYEYLISQGYILSMSEYEYEECRKKSNLYYVEMYEVNGIITQSNLPKIIITVDKDNKIAINKQYNGSFVYRLGHLVFNQARRVRFPYELQH